MFPMSRERDSASVGTPEADGLAAELAERFRGRLRLFAARRIHDPAAAEDVAQEAMRRTLEALRDGRITDPARLPGFVFETARHICMHHGRGRGREARALARMGPGGASAEDPLQALITRERQEAVRHALQRLGADDRDLLKLMYGEGLDAAEAGRRLEVSPEAVRVRKHRALRRLAGALEADGNDPGPLGTSR
jgi:RNA polymerase sigma-70 factor (ECF subfamily)